MVPTVHTSTDSFKKNIGIAKRGCRFLNENNIKGGESIFNHYTQKGCLFECSMRSGWQFNRFFGRLNHGLNHGINHGRIRNTNDALGDDLGHDEGGRKTY